MTVYLIGYEKPGSQDIVKIGFSNDPDKRLRELQTGSPFKLRLVKTYPGGRDLERRLHELFSDVRLHGEWFRVSVSDIDPYIYGTSEPRIVWQCDLCLAKPATGGSLSVNITETESFHEADAAWGAQVGWKDIFTCPSPPKWQIFCGKCDEKRLLAESAYDDYAVPITDVNTQGKLLHFLSHVTRKYWFPDSDMTRVLDHAASIGGWAATALPGASLAASVTSNAGAVSSGRRKPRDVAVTQIVSQNRLKLGSRAVAAAVAAAHPGLFGKAANPGTAAHSHVRRMIRAGKLTQDSAGNIDVPSTPAEDQLMTQLL